MERPSKRPKTGSESHHDNRHHVIQDELSMNPVQFNIEQDPLYELDKGRANAASRLKSRFESIFEKYERDFTGIGDEINFHTGEVVINNGHLEAFLNEDDSISEDDYDSDDASSGNDADEGQISNRSPLGHIEPAPPPDPVDTRDKWILPESLPEFAGLDLSRSANGNGSLLSTNSHMQPASVLGQSQFSHAPPKLNPGLLQFDSYGQARQQNTLSNMLDRAKRSRFTDARSFEQAQISASSIKTSGAMIEDPGDFEDEAESNRIRATTTEYASEILLYRHGDNQPTSAQSTTHFSVPGEPISRLKKKLKDLHTNAHPYKVKKPRTVKFPKASRRLKGRANIELAAVDGISERKRGRPRKVPLAEAGVSERKRGRPRKIAATHNGVTEAEFVPSQAAGDKDIESDIRSNHEDANPTELQRPVLSNGEQTKSGRHHKRPDFYGDIISTLEIEQRLLESDEDNSGDDGSDVQSTKEAQSLPWRIFEPVDGRGSSESPVVLSQRTIRDSEEPVSSIPRSSAQESKSTKSPRMIHRKVIRDSQDPGSSLPSSLRTRQSDSPLKSIETSQEVFSRNNIDSSYGFSDGEEEDVGVLRHRHTPKDSLIEVAETVDSSAVDLRQATIPGRTDADVEMKADHPVPAQGKAEVALQPGVIETLGDNDLGNPSPEVPVTCDEVLCISSDLPRADYASQPDAINLETIAKHDTWVIEIPTQIAFHSAHQQDISQEEHSPDSDAQPLDSINVLGSSPRRNASREIGTFVAGLAADDTPEASAHVDESMPRETSSLQAESSGVRHQASSPKSLSPEKTEGLHNSAMHAETPGTMVSPSPLARSPTQLQHSSPSQSLSPKYVVDNPNISLKIGKSAMSESPPPRARSPSVQRRSSSLERPSPEKSANAEIKLVTPDTIRTRQGSVKTSSGSRRRVLALSRLIPEQTSEGGDEDELYTSSPVKHSSSLFRGALSRSRSGLGARRSSTPHGRSTPDPTKKKTRNGPAQASTAANDSNHKPQDTATTPTTKIGYGFSNARGVAPRRMSSSSSLSKVRTPGSTTAPKSSGSASTSSTVVVSRPKPSLEPTSPSKTSQMSPLARQTLTANTSNAGAVTPKNRKRKLREAMGESGDDGDNDDEGELVQTPGGTMRRCGKDSFTCDRDFCMVCCI